MSLNAPGSATYLEKDVADHDGSKSELTLFEYFNCKTRKVKAWPLKTFDEFLSFCRQGQRLCAASSKDVAVVNAAFFQALMDIAIRAHDQQSRRGAPGPGEISFKVRMYMHIQYATNLKVLHTGASAAR